MDSPPNQTIYVNNLYEKMGKEKLKTCLRAMFSQFGDILDIVCHRSLKLRGQAWIVFGDMKSATNALRTMQGFPFFDKPIRIQYAKTKSDAVAKLDGTYQEREKREGKEKAANQSKPETGKRPAGNASASVNAPKMDFTNSGGGGGGQTPPNKILFVQNLPEATNEMMLNMLFQQFPGFREVRMVESRPGIAFVEFETEQQSGVAMEGLQGFQISPQHSMNISFAKQ